ncbi:DUF262 domain-containing protein [Saccharopolyspora sp. SCSIO 74807]|uniref:DUF262 domain-containing protein n=1 Tax=Saccharopolyspora sp. SCSIO 74807 TaxID=3118084 RepID=UPI0030CE8AFA
MTQSDSLDQLDEQLLEERKKVDVANHNFSARELIRMMAEEELNVAPTYQRKFRWNLDNESTFIESVFLGLPIPPLFVATNVGFQWEIVDGLQRLSTLMHFMAVESSDLSLISRTEPLQLEGLDKLTQLNGKKFSDLPKNLRVYFGRQPLQVVSLTDKSDLQIRFDLFERLNKGSVSLSPQEVRACVYRGEFNQFIENLSVDPSLGALLKLQQAKQNDGTKAEQVLKFFAYKNARDKFNGKVEKFLNEYMVAASKEFSYDAEGQSFQKAIRRLYEICDGPFLRKSTNVTPVVQFEACIVAIAELQESGVPVIMPNPGWTEDNKLKDSSTGATNTRAMLTSRIDRAKEIFSGRA